MTVFHTCDIISHLSCKCGGGLTAQVAVLGAVVCGPRHVLAGAGGLSIGGAVVQFVHTGTCWLCGNLSCMGETPTGDSHQVV